MAKTFHHVVCHRIRPGFYSVTSKDLKKTTVIAQSETGLWMTKQNLLFSAC